MEDFMTYVNIQNIIKHFAYIMITNGKCGIDSNFHKNTTDLVRITMFCSRQLKRFNHITKKNNISNTPVFPQESGKPNRISQFLIRKNNTTLKDN